MSFTDLATLARQQQQPPPQQQDQQQQDPNAPGGPAPDTSRFQHSPLNPASQNVQTASLEGGGVPAGLETDADLGDEQKTIKPYATGAQQQDEASEYGPPVVFAPSVFDPPKAREVGDFGKDPFKIADLQPGLLGGPDYPSTDTMYAEIVGGANRLSRMTAPEAAREYTQAMFYGNPILALLNGISHGKFEKNFTIATTNRIAYQQREMFLANQRALAAQQYYLQGLDNILFLGAPGENGAPPVLNAQELNDRLHDFIWRIPGGPHSILALELERDGPRGVARWLRHEDELWQRQLSAHKQASKVIDPYQDEREHAAVAGRDTTPYERTTVGSGSIGWDPSQLPGRDLQMPQRGRATAPATDQTNKEPLTPLEQQIAQNGGYASDPAFARGVMDFAHARYNGDPDPSGREVKKGSTVDNQINAAQAAIAADVNRIANEKPVEGETPAAFKQRRLEQLRKTDPQTARDVEGLLNYQTDPKGLTTAKGERKRAVNLVRAFDPKWNQNGYAIVQKYHDPSNPTVRTIQRVSAFLPAINELNSALLRVDPASHPLGAAATKLYNQTWTGNDVYPQIYSAIVNVIQEEQAIISGTGRPSVSIARDRARHMLETMSPAQIQSQLFEDAAAAYGNVKNINSQFKQELGDPNAQLPFYPKEAEREYRAILRMNPHTGELPADAPGNVLAAQPPPGRAVPKWVKDQGLDWKPLTEQQVRDGRRMIRKYQNSTDPKTQADVQRIRARLGMFAEPDYPGEDPDAGQPQ